MAILKWDKYFFLGIGGIGMSALARYFLLQGKTVLGYDKTPSALTAELEEMGATFTSIDSPDFISTHNIDPTGTLVIITPAIPKTDLLKQYVETQNFTCLKRSEVLGEISKTIPTIAIGGTHGKTTTSAMMAHTLQTAAVNQQSFLGGIAGNFKSNLVFEDDALWSVAEADEYDRSFHRLHPKIGVITNIDPDHLDIYNSPEDMLLAYREFAELVPAEGHLIVNQLVQEQLKLEHPNLITYSIQHQADARVNFIVPENGKFAFGIYFQEKEYRFHLNMPGIHNVENAVAVFCVGKVLGIPSDKIGKSFETFMGVNRRFQYHLNEENIKVIDDYAHHPTEIDSLRDSLRLLYPAGKLTAIFQPHLFSRTRDFMDAFAHALSGFDEVILLDIYPARELPIEGITSASLLEKINLQHKTLCSKSELNQLILDWKPQIVCFIGAGDIGLLPNHFVNAYKQIAA